MPHTFQVGQVVRAIGRFYDRTGQEGVYEIVRLLRPDTDGVPKYRIRSAAQGKERVVMQQEISRA